MGFLKAVERKINEGPLYNPLRYSAVPDAVMEMLTGKTEKAVRFYRSFLENPQNGKAVIFDIGANKGNKTAAFVKMGFSVIAVEPERKSLETLRYRFGNHPRVTILPVGVSAEPGKLRLQVFDPRSGFNTFSTKGAAQQYANKEQGAAVREEYEVAIVTLDNLIEKHGKPLYIKIDVEGLEKPVIEGLSQAVPFLSFEANLPFFTAETREIVARLMSINSNTKFKISRNDVLQSASWMDETQMLSWLNSHPEGTYEIIASTTAG